MLRSMNKTSFRPVSWCFLRDCRLYPGQRLVRPAAVIQGHTEARICAGVDAIRREAAMFPLFGRTRCVLEGWPRGKGERGGIQRRGPNGESVCTD